MTELELTKAKLGITSSARDEYIGVLISSIYAEWENVNGIRLSASERASVDVIDLVADVAVFKYQNHGGPLPSNLRLRLNNLYVERAGLPMNEVDPDWVAEPVVDPEEPEV